MTARSFGIVVLGRAAVMELAGLLRWWADELKDLSSALFNQASLQALKPLRLQMSEAGVTVQAQANPAVSLLQLSLPECADPAARRTLAAAGLPSRASVRIELPESEVLLCSLRLPALRDADLAAAVELQLERELPLPREQVYIDWRPGPRGVDEPLLTVTVGIARRQTVDTRTAAVRSLGWTVSGIGTQATGEWRWLPQRARAIDLSIGPRDRRLIAVAATLAFVYLMTVAAHWAYERSSLAEELMLARQHAAELAAQRTQLATEAEPIRTLQRIMSAPDGADVVQSLTRVVPLDTWLYRTQISVPIAGQATLELGGYGPSPTTLVDTLEQHPDFDHVELIAATRGVDASGRSRIELKAQWRRADVPNGRAK